MKFGNKLIGLVDDEHVFHWIAEKFIEKINHGLRSISLYNGNEALEYLSDPKNQVPDILFLDLNMPIANGWKFLDEFEKIRKNISKEVKIYILSSSIDPEDHKRAKNYDYVQKFISKPITQKIIEGVLA